MYMFYRYPKLRKKFTKLCKFRRNQILSRMLIFDKTYRTICCNRAAKSMKLKNALIGTSADVLFEKYSDSVYAQECYELDAIYKRAIMDAITIINNQMIN